MIKRHNRRSATDIDQCFALAGSKQPPTQREVLIYQKQKTTVMHHGVKRPQSIAFEPHCLIGLSRQADPLHPLEPRQPHVPLGQYRSHR